MGIFNFSVTIFAILSGTHSSTEITESVLKTDGSASGTWISNLNILDIDANYCELRVKGETIPGTIFYISTNNGATYQSISKNIKEELSPPGKNFRIKIELNSASTQVYGVALLYS